VALLVQGGDDDAELAHIVCSGHGDLTLAPERVISHRGSGSGCFLLVLGFLGGIPCGVKVPHDVVGDGDLLRLLVLATFAGNLRLARPSRRYPPSGTQVVNPSTKPHPRRRATKGRVLGADACQVNTRLHGMKPWCGMYLWQHGSKAADARQGSRMEVLGTNLDGNCGDPFATRLAPKYAAVLHTSGHFRLSPPWRSFWKVAEGL
jgi:hypothetical protein